MIEAALRAQLARQVTHWTMAAEELRDLSRIASPIGWQSLERDLGTAIQSSLADSVARLVRQGVALRALLSAAETHVELRKLRGEVLRFRQRYLAVEALLDFYGDAVNTRTSQQLATLLRACDRLASRSMRAVLDRLAKKTPPVLTYVDKGLGASILKAGLRLWDGRSISAVAAIKIVRHNLYRPTSLIHETGHQIAHILSWNDELAGGLKDALQRHSTALASLWAGWASEIAADAFAFGHTGFASVAALHDVVSGSTAAVLGVLPFDPHPTSWVRVLLGREMCRRFFGRGPWDPLADAWMAVHPLRAADASAQELLGSSREVLPEIVEVIFERGYRAFAGRPFVDVLDPARVRPDALLELERTAGGALFASSHWLESESLRLLALAGYRAATEPERVQQILRQQEEWMVRLGALAAA